jgi:DNA polymerase-3 subunit epsilon
MGLILVYDTETTGLPLFNDPSEDPRQPHIVQIAALLTDGDEVVERYTATVKPEGWIIPDDVAAIHGITTERALAEGVPERDVVTAFLSLWRKAARRVAHNETFDARIIRIALMRFYDAALADEWKASPSGCTATASTKVLKLPPTAKMLAAGRRHYKTPNLGEAYQFFLGRQLENAHTAEADAIACFEVMKRLRLHHDFLKAAA